MSTTSVSRVAELLSIYRQAALEEAAASAIGDHRSASRYHGTISRVYRELRQHGPEATRSLLDLLADMHPEIRAQAAAHALELAPTRGEEVLSELVALGGPAGRRAETVLKAWRDGALGLH